MKSYEVKVESALIAEEKGTFVTKGRAEVELDYGGIPGDLHFGLTKQAGVREKMYPRGEEIFNRRQITVVSAEECAVIAKKLGVEKIIPEWLGANFMLSGFPELTQLAPGSRLLFPSGAGLLCEGVNAPCVHPGKVIQNQYPDVPKLAPRFVKAATGLRGIAAIVERPGKVVTGEKAEIVEL
ncbi:MAG TPA: MOSC domain-containing protein [Bacillales bacterium]|nr:MOSC domain-containing protein [Bacillales bacterium]